MHNGGPQSSAAIQPHVTHHVTPADRLAYLRKVGGARAWRQKIPYSDEQILSAFDRVIAAHDATNPAQAAKSREVRAAFLRTRRLSWPLLRYLLPYLVTTCALCGEQATHMYGTDGRCDLHKHVKPDHVLAKEARHLRRGQEIAHARLARDYRDLARLAVRTTRAFAR